MILVDVVGLLQLTVYILTHLRGTYRFLKMNQVMMRVFTKDIHGSIAPIHRGDQ